MTHTVVPLLLLLSIHAAPVPAAESNEVAGVRELFSAIASAPPGRSGIEQLRAPFASALYRSCGRVLNDSGVVGLEADDLKDLSKRVNEQVEANLRLVPPEGTARRETLEEFGRRVTTDQAAAALVAVWLGHTPPAAPAKTAPEATETPDANQIRPLVSQLSVEGAGEIAPVASEVGLLAEFGGSGAGNGLLDAGEWVQLKLPVENRGERPWFSTSAFLESASPCLWVDSSAEHELGELHRTGERAEIRAWLYLSGECGPGPRELRVRLLDTHRASGAPVYLRVALRPLDVRPPAGANLRLDADLPGSSDGSELRELSPGLKFEVTQDFVLGAGFPAPIEAQVDYRAPQALAALFASFALEEQRLLPSPDSSLLAAGDDLDATVVAREQFTAVLRAASAYERWLPDGRQGRLWLAADVSLAVAPPGAPTPQSLATARNAGQPAAASCPAEWPQARELVSLVRKHLELRAHPVTPSLTKSVAAASGVELLFDDAGFAEAYQRLRPAAAAASAAVPPAAGPAPLRYTFRTYRALPVMALLRAPEARPAPEPTPAPKIEELPGVKLEPLRLRLQLGGAWIAHGVHQPTGVEGPYLAGATTANFGNLDLRLAAGWNLHAIAGFNWGYAALTRYEVAQELVGEFGLGYLLQFNRIEVAPHLLGLFRYRRLMQLELTEKSINLAAGATVRYRLTDLLGAYCLAEYRLGANGPTAIDRTELIDGSGLRLGAGLALFF